MGDALLLEMIERLKEIFSESPHQIERGHIVAPQTLARVRSPAFSIRMAARPETVRVSMSRTMFW